MSDGLMEARANERLRDLVADHTASVAKTLKDRDYERFVSDLQVRLDELTELLPLGSLQGRREDFALEFAARCREKLDTMAT